MEDFVTWVDTSKLKRHIASYNVSSLSHFDDVPKLIHLRKQDELDDFDLLA